MKTFTEEKNITFNVSYFRVNTRKELENSQRQLRLKEDRVVKYEQQIEESVVVKEQIARLQKEKVLAINEKEKAKEKVRLIC